ncbi:MAG: extracellular solute-binding protein [Lachnospiraceae bacterium]|nr:extracellular solute-binding protein [Lachnospiraceae bacterium]
MKTFKKQFCILISIIMLISMTGCGNFSNSTKNNLTIAVRSGVYAEVIKKCLPGFEEKTGITCRVVEFSEEDLHNNLLNDSVNKNGFYDLCMIDGSWVAEFLSEGLLTDLSELGYSFDDDIIPATTSICKAGGEIYLVPFYGNVSVMLFNKNVAAELGYGEDDFDSLEDVIKYSLLASENGHGGFACRGDSENDIVVDFLPILRSFGGWVVDGNNAPCVESEEFKKAMEIYMFLIENGCVAPKEEIIDGIEKGEISVAVGWPGWCDPEINTCIDLVPFPGKVSDDSPEYNSNIFGIWTLGIPDNCTDKETAVRLLEYLMDPEVQRESVSFGGIPCRYSILQDPELNLTNHHLNIICDALDNGIYRPVMKKWPNFYTVLGDKMDKIIKKELSVDDGLLLAQTELEVLMK